VLSTVSSPSVARWLPNLQQRVFETLATTFFDSVDLCKFNQEVLTKLPGSPQCRAEDLPVDMWCMPWVHEGTCSDYAVFRVAMFRASLSNPIGGTVVWPFHGQSGPVSIPLYCGSSGGCCRVSRAAGSSRTPSERRPILAFTDSGGPCFPTFRDYWELRPSPRNPLLASVSLLRSVSVADCARSCNGVRDSDTWLRHILSETLVPCLVLCALCMVELSMGTMRYFHLGGLYTDGGVEELWRSQIGVSSAFVVFFFLFEYVLRCCARHQQASQGTTATSAPAFWILLRKADSVAAGCGFLAYVACMLTATVAYPAPSGIDNKGFQLASDALLFLALFLWWTRVNWWCHRQQRMFVLVTLLLQVVAQLVIFVFDIQSIPPLCVSEPCHNHTTRVVYLLTMVTKQLYLWQFLRVALGRIKSFRGRKRTPEATGPDSSSSWIWCWLFVLYGAQLSLATLKGLNISRESVQVVVLLIDFCAFVYGIYVVVGNKPLVDMHARLGRQWKAFVTRFVFPLVLLVIVDLILSVRSDDHIMCLLQVSVAPTNS
jgi:hypothetical protein